MRSRNLIRRTFWIVPLLVCSMWLLASASAASDDDDDGPQFGPWSAPVNLGPAINTLAQEQGPTISKAGLSLYFQSNRLGGFGGMDIYVSQRASVGDPWGPPQNLGPNINTAYNDGGAVFSRDGHRLYFQSNRPGGFGGNDIYVSRRHNKRDDFGWRAAENLGSGVNSFANEVKAEYFEDDETGTITLYFWSDRPGGLGNSDIYVSTLQPDETFGPAVLVEEFSSIYGDFSVTLRRDGLEAIVSSNRSDLPKIGASDLWVFSRASTADPWSPPTNLGIDVNSPSEEVGASLSFDGTALYFFSNRPGTLGGFDLYVSTRTKLPELDEDKE